MPLLAGKKDANYNQSVAEKNLNSCPFARHVHMNVEKKFFKGVQHRWSSRCSLCPLLFACILCISWVSSICILLMFGHVRFSSLFLIFSLVCQVVTSVNIHSKSTYIIDGLCLLVVDGLIVQGNGSYRFGCLCLLLVCRTFSTFYRIESSNVGSKTTFDGGIHYANHDCHHNRK